MNSTQYSLLERLQGRDESAESWTKFINIYAPLLDEWARRLRIPEQDRADLFQETFVKLLTGIARFQKSGPGSFRAWLFTVLRNCWLDKLRRSRPSETLNHQWQDAQIGDPSQVIEYREYQEYLLRRVFSLVIADFPSKTQDAFKSYVLDGDSAVDVSQRLGISVNALYLIRSRVLRRIKSELAGLIDDE